MKIAVTLIILLASYVALFAQNIKEYYIYCDQDDFQYIYQNYNQDIYIPISIKHNNVTIESASMRIRGDGSRVLPKKSLKVKLDNGVFLEGINTFNFNAEYEDKSYKQQYIASRIFRESGHACFRTEHVRLYLNDNFLGLYLYVENVDEDFLEANSLDPNGSLYKATIDGASLSIYDNVYYHWESKASDQNFVDLIEFIDILNNTPDEEYLDFAKTVLDYDKMINMLAVNLLLRNYSSYYHNYYMYHDINNTGKWVMLPWDLDKMFLYYEVTYIYNHTSKFWAPDNPILERAIICEPIFEDLRKRIDTLHATIINDEYITQIVDSLEVLLEQSVVEDITDDIGSVDEWKNKVQSARTAFDTRYSKLNYQFENYARSFKVIRSQEQYFVGQYIKLEWQSTIDPNDLDLSYSLYYGTNMNLDSPETTIISGLTDTTYTITNNLNEGKYFWKVKANTSAYSFEGFDNYNFFFVVSESPDIVINEIFYKPDAEVNIGDWVELYNNSPFAVDLSNWYLQDENDENSFVIPDGTVIQPNQYLVLCNNFTFFNLAFPHINDVIGNFSFGLNSDGELIRLKSNLSQIKDAVNYLSDDPWPLISGSPSTSIELISVDLDNSLPESWQKSKMFYGTPGKPNTDSLYTDWSKYPVEIVCSPNPFNEITRFGYITNRNGNVEISLYNSTGQMVALILNEFQSAGLYSIDWNGEALNNGMYFLKVNFNKEEAKTIKVVKL